MSAAVMLKAIKRILFASFLLLIAVAANAQQLADRVVVKKSESRLYLEKQGKVFASFKVAFGAQSSGHKQQQGDQRTPEGIYVLDAKNRHSRFYKAIHISYPNTQDSARAKARGVDAGGAVMIHGQKNGLGWLAPITQLFDWTAGCIALSNRDMDAVWSAVNPGTPIQIFP
jgi:murein L,D-transpeptidase YafK